MKNLLSILGAISLITIESINLTACKNNNNSNENIKGNEPKNKPEPQQPPENSNWKLIGKTEFLNLYNKWSIVILDNNRGRKNIWHAVKIEPIWEDYETRSKVLYNLQYANNSKYKPIFYVWNKNNEPELPKINKNNYKINWNEKKGLNKERTQKSK